MLITEVTLSRAELYNRLKLREIRQYVEFLSQFLHVELMNNIIIIVIITVSSSYLSIYLIQRA